MLWVGPLSAVAVDAGAGYVWCKLPSHYVLSPVIDKSCQAGPAQHTPHKALSSPAWELLGTASTSSLGGEKREKACHKHWDRLSVSIQECIQSRSSDADLGWLWAPPMNLSCMAFKIKANKERFGRLGIVPAPCPSLTSQQFSPEWRSGAGDITILSVAPDQIWYLYTPSDHQAAGSLTKPSVIGKLGTKHKMFVDSVFYWA